MGSRSVNIEAQWTTVDGIGNVGGGYACMRMMQYPPLE